MTCDRVQADLSRAMDGEIVLPSAVWDHVSECDECQAFQDAAADVGRRYRIQVLAGIDRLRRLEPATLPSRRASKARLLMPVAAAMLLCWWAVRPAQPPATVVVAAPQASTLPRIGFLNDVFAAEEVSFLHSPAVVLPVRLDLELLPGESTGPEIALPRSLRF